MRLALKEAEKAFAHDEVPVGAVVVDQEGKVIGKGYNQVEKKHSQIAHAEVIAIKKANEKIGDWRLNGCRLYVTLEPCIMCIGLIQLSRLQAFVYAVRSKLFGYQLDKNGKIPLYNKNIEVKEGILADEAAYILKQFFKQKRK